MSNKTYDDVSGEIIGDVGGFRGQLTYEDRPQGHYIEADSLDELYKQARAEKQKLLDQTASIRFYCYADASLWRLRIYGLDPASVALPDFSSK